MGKCLICKARFEAKYFLQKVCSIDDCRVKYAILVVGQNKQANEKKKHYSIPKVSKKMTAKMLQYAVVRTEFLGKPENRICFIEGCDKPSTTIEHRAGRGINYLNVSTWAGCCLEHNLELENNPEMSKKYQLSKIHGGKKL